MTPEPEAVKRRTLLKQAGGAGLGFTVLSGNEIQNRDRRAARILNIGIRYSILDNIEPFLIEDCSPPNYGTRAGNAIFYQQGLDEDEHQAVRGEGPFVMGKRVVRPPVHNPTITGNNYLPTTLDNNLNQTRGAIIASDVETPSIDVLEVSEETTVHVNGEPISITSEEEVTLELPQHSLRLRQYEKHPVRSESASGEGEEGGAKYRPISVDVDVKPILSLRNLGHVPYLIARNHTGVDPNDL
jgi:hypothetical protein